MPAEYYLDTIRTVFQDFALVNGTWDVRRASACARRTSRAARCCTIEGELDDISGAGQTARRARPVHAASRSRRSSSLRRRGRRPLRHLLRPPLARAGRIPQVARLHRAHSRGGASRAAPSDRPRQAPQRDACGAGYPQVARCRLPPAMRLAARIERRPAADPVHALRLSRLPRLRRGDRRRRAPNQPVPARRRRRALQRLAALTGRPPLPLDPATAPRGRAGWPSSTKPGASAARCASRPARSTRSSARPSACTR